MKALPVIIAAVVALTLIRVGLRRRGRGQLFPTGVLPAQLRGRNLLGDTGLVAGREIRERVRGRLFRGVTVILFVVVAAAVVIPTIHTASSNQESDGRRGGRINVPRHRAATPGRQGRAGRNSS